MYKVKRKLWFNHICSHYRSKAFFYYLALVTVRDIELLSVGVSMSEQVMTGILQIAPVCLSRVKWFHQKINGNGPLYKV